MLLEFRPPILYFLEFIATPAAKLLKRIKTQGGGLSSDTANPRLSAPGRDGAGRLSRRDGALCTLSLYLRLIYVIFPLFSLVYNQ